MPLKKFELQPGNEVRGLRVRLYPSAEDEAKLEILMRDIRRGWNWIVAKTEDTLEARTAYAIRQGLVVPRPVHPIYDGLAPEESKATKEAYQAACRAWHGKVHEATKKDPACAFRSLKQWQEHFGDKYDYQLMARVIGWRYEDEAALRTIRPGAHMLQALVKNYFTKGAGQRRKKFRKSRDPMPLQVRSGDCFELGDFGTRGASHGHVSTGPYYNCLISFNGLKIRGRLPGRAPEGRVLEGVSLTKEADGWWASIKQEVPVRVPPPAIPNSVVGIDVGLDVIAAISEGREVVNPAAEVFGKMGPMLKGHEKPVRVMNARGKAYAERIAGRQTAKLPVGRLHLAAERHVRHVIYNEIIKPLANIETIKIEKLSSKIGQMGSKKTSAMRRAVEILQERYGARVREVMPHFTSQDCSHCSYRSKESWSYEHGRYGECPRCGHKEDRDVNASRNVASRPVIPLGPS